MSTNSFRSQHQNLLGRQAQVTGSAPAEARKSGAIGAGRFTQYFNKTGSEQVEQYLGRGDHKRMLPEVNKQAHTLSQLTSLAAGSCLKNKHKVTSFQEKLKIQNLGLLYFYLLTWVSYLMAFYIETPSAFCEAVHASQCTRFQQKYLCGFYLDGSENSLPYLRHFAANPTASKAREALPHRSTMRATCLILTFLVGILKKDKKE